MDMRVRVGDVIEPAALRRAATWPIVNFSTVFLGKKLLLSNSISHLGHILTYNLSDDEDIRKTSRDMCCKANYLYTSRFFLL